MEGENLGTNPSANSYIFFPPNSLLPPPPPPLYTPAMQATEQRHQNMKCLFYMIKKQKTVILRHQLKCERYLTCYTKWNVPLFKLTSCLSLVLVVPIGRMSLPLSRIFFTCQKYHLLVVHRGGINGETSIEAKTFV